MSYNDEPSPFNNVQEAAEALVNAFIGENIGGPYALMWSQEYTPKFVIALQSDGVLPNLYEVDALNGAVPLDGSDPSSSDAVYKDHGCPDFVAAKFPATNKLIADQF